MRWQNVLLYSTFVIIFFILPLKSLFAKDTDFGIANYLPINDKNIREGSIISSDSQGFFLTRIPYDPKIVGVVSNSSAISFNINQSDKNVQRYQVVSTGTVGVNVSTVNGNIAKGDLITSSNTPGIGMKANKAGFILGTSLDSYSSKNANEIKRIHVVLNLKYATTKTTVRSSLFDIANLSALAWTDDPLTVFKYVVAALILIFSIILGFYLFGRLASRGVEALGRNPLAGRMIQLGIIINVLITIAIIGAGIVVAFFILTI